jgi:hypothetical protein
MAEDVEVKRHAELLAGGASALEPPDGPRQVPSLTCNIAMTGAQCLAWERLS